MKKLSLFMLSLGLITQLWSAGEIVVAENFQPTVKKISISNAVSFEEVAQSLYEASDNDHIHGVLLEINSQGGSCSSFGRLYQLISCIKKKKPVVAFVLDNALSSGYLLASAAHYIVCGQFSFIGNIGAFIEIKRVTNSTPSEYFFAGDFKALSVNDGPTLTAEQRDFCQEQVNYLYDIFCFEVAKNRGLDIKKHKKWADGRVFIGEQALKVDLVDQIGTVFDAKNKLYELLHDRYPNRHFEHFIWAS